jgi:hypothetical protein
MRILPLANTRRNHQTSPWKAKATRFSLIPPAVLPAAPPMNMIMAKKSSVVLAHVCRFAFWNPVVERAETVMKSPCLSAITRSIS